MPAKRRAFGHFRPCSAWHVAAWSALLASTPALFPALAQDAPPAGQALRVMSLDVSKAPAMAAPLVRGPARPAWRTSFGSEREAPRISAGPVAGLDADVVLLQGVTNLNVLHKAFPGRTWRLVVSRQMVLTDDPVDPRSYEAMSSAPATAVAVRYQAGVRIAGQEHFLPRKLETGPPQPALSAGTAVTSAGTAVRFNIGGHFVWIASVAFKDACRDAAQPCPERDNLETWRAAKLAAGDAVIAGGLQRVAHPATTPCLEQSIAVYSARKDAAAVQSDAQLREGLGCVATAAAGGEPKP